MFLYIQCKYENETFVRYTRYRYFKDYNDCFGHDSGDATLRQMATRFNDEKTADTTFYRIGGEEFALIIEKKRSKQSDGRPSTSTITPFKVRIPYEREYSKGACRWGNISIHRLLFGFKRHTCFGRPEISQIIFRGRDNTLVGKGSPIASVFC